MTYRLMKKPRLIPGQVALTLGELAFLVSSRPCTIHGWRPISVRTQPALAAMYGNAIAAIAVRWNQRARSSFFFQYSHPPRAATRNISPRVKAIPRIDEYTPLTLGM